jgi:hypothetical protein
MSQRGKGDQVRIVIDGVATPVVAEQLHGGAD